MKATIKNINKEALKYGYELFKGNGYFYWSPLDSNKSPGLMNSMVMVYALYQVPTVEPWIFDLKNRILDMDILW